MVSGKWLIKKSLPVNRKRLSTFYLLLTIYHLPLTSIAFQKDANKFAKIGIKNIEFINGLFF